MSSTIPRPNEPDAIIPTEPTAAGRERPGDVFTAEDRKRLLGIDTNTIALMRRAAPLLEAAAADMVAEFYARVRRVPHLTGLIERHSSHERLAASMQRYILEFATTDLDAAHDASRMRIAAIHDRIDLPLDAYTVQVQAIRCGWSRAVMAIAGKRRGVVMRIRRDEALDYIEALDKMLSYDEGLVCLAFLTTRQERVEQALAEIRAARAAGAASQRELNDFAGQLAAASEETSAAGEQLAATAEQVADEVAGASEAAAQTGATATAGIEVMSAATDSVASVTQAAAATNRIGAELEERSQAISSITADLRGIAESTNLLALNAAIEAARAGDAGRGFAVVAEEVRKLATNTREQLEHANGAVAQMQVGLGDLHAAREALNENAAALQEANAAARDQFGEIHAAVGATSERMETIAAAAEEVAAAAGETGRASGEVARLAERVKEVADGLSADAGAGDAR